MASPPATPRRRARTAALILAALVATALGLIPATAGASPVSLHAYWSLDERYGQVVHDASGNGNDGRLGSTPRADTADPAWIAGWNGGALAFSGHSYIQIPSSPTLETPPTLTVSATFRGDRSPGPWRYLVSKGSRGCRSASYGLYSGPNGGLGFYISGTEGFVVSPLARRSVWDGRWHHAAGSFDGTAVRLFVDGREIGAGTATTSAIAYGLPSDSAYLGAYRGHCNLMLRGDLDDVAIWGRALSKPEVGVVAERGPRAVSPTSVREIAAAPVGRPAARCVKPRRSRRCRVKVSFRVRRHARVRVDVARLRARRARRVGSFHLRVRPPRVSFRLPARIGRRQIGPGRYRVTLMRLHRGRARAIASTVARVR